MREVEAHLDETYFAWMGSTDAEGPFYYRVQSPVVLIEFDHHPGVVFDNRVPSRNHIHTVVRTPNAGDYGVDLLRQHHDRFDHTAAATSHGTDSLAPEETISRSEVEAMSNAGRGLGHVRLGWSGRWRPHRVRG